MNKSKQIELIYSDKENNIFTKLYLKEIKDVMKYLLSKEISKLQKNYDSLEILYHHYDYINDLGNLQKSIDNNVKPLLVLKMFITIYNKKHTHTNSYYILIE